MMIQPAGHPFLDCLQAKLAAVEQQQLQQLMKQAW
jgi:hypothetical protein